MVQFAAAAANRVTPAGVGGAAVNARFFTRNGLDAGGLAGPPGEPHELATLWSRLSALVRGMASTTTIVTVLVVVAISGAIVSVLRRRRKAPN